MGLWKKMNTAVWQIYVYWKDFIWELLTTKLKVTVQKYIWNIWTNEKTSSKNFTQQRWRLQTNIIWNKETHSFCNFIHKLRKHFLWKKTKKKNHPSYVYCGAWKLFANMGGQVFVLLFWPNFLTFSVQVTNL